MLMGNPEGGEKGLNGIHLPPQECWTPTQKPVELALQKEKTPPAIKALRFKGKCEYP